MNRFEQLLFLGSSDRRIWKRYILDALLAFGGALVVTIIIYGFKLYPKIPNISFLYLLVVLSLASTRGLYSAIIASLIAFLSFDYFLVNPLYTFSIGKLDEWLALFIFLVTAIITGQLASALRKRAEQATQQERETRALYELVTTTTNVEGLERQLETVARAIVDVFSSVGVRDCAILLPDEREQLKLYADACLPLAEVQLSSDEEKTADMVMAEGQIVDLYADAVLPSTEWGTAYHVRRIVAGNQREGHFYVRILPLQLGQKTVGVARLIIESGSHHMNMEHNLAVEKERHNPQTAFFWAFLDQAASLIERARLRREGLQVELLRRTDELRSALLSSVSHDFRTPLSSIKAAGSSLLQEDVQWNEEERRSFAQAIVKETDRLNRLVGNLLDMSRIEGGALKPEKEWYPLDELIHDVLGRAQALLHDRQVHIDLPEDLPPVEIDYLQMDQVLTNLIENAIRYTPVASPIDISAEVQGANILVSIADRGSGIPPGDLERIFDKFYRVLGTRRKGTSAMGTGLGLAVCRGLVEAHGGRIWARNRQGGGAIFQFTLPLGKAGVEGYE
jgi:two-component system sensor histidine kinase KdpD